MRQRVSSLRVLAVGSRAFVSGFQLAGVAGKEVSSPMEALEAIRRIVEEKDVGLILVSDDLAKQVRDELAMLRSKRPVPLVYELPSPGSKAEKVEYRELLKKVLKIG